MKMPLKKSTAWRGGAFGLDARSLVAKPLFQNLPLMEVEQGYRWIKASPVVVREVFEHSALNDDEGREVNGSRLNRLPRYKVHNGLL